jgi:hypothetical protein
VILMPGHFEAPSSSVLFLVSFMNTSWFGCQIQLCKNLLVMMRSDHQVTLSAFWAASFSSLKSILLFFISSMIADWSDKSI